AHRCLACFPTRRSSDLPFARRGENGDGGAADASAQSLRGRRGVCHGPRGGRPGPDRGGVRLGVARGAVLRGQRTGLPGGRRAGAGTGRVPGGGSAVAAGASGGLTGSATDGRFAPVRPENCSSGDACRFVTSAVGSV